MLEMKTWCVQVNKTQMYKAIHIHQMKHTILIDKKNYILLKY